MQIFNIHGTRTVVGLSWYEDYEDEEDYVYLEFRYFDHPPIPYLAFRKIELVESSINRVTHY